MVSSSHGRRDVKIVLAAMFLTVALADPAFASICPKGTIPVTLPDSTMICVGNPITH